jgi:hypothetical protein
MYTINTPEELRVARDILGYYGLPGGYQPGGFTSAMIRLLEVADYINQARLLNEFTEFRPAFDIMVMQGGSALVKAVEEAGKQLA